MCVAVHLYVRERKNACAYVGILLLCTTDVFGGDDKKYIFIVESVAQLKEFEFPDVENVDIRSSKGDRAWSITPVFWKAKLT